uniref:YbaY family lipoprotein n=1 Tax=Marinobacterium profundum TaxID=1714300 RepID=UPI000B0D8DD0|nr:YbaY family lipoprotein [Marinobacterium profundum]
MALGKGNAVPVLGVILLTWLLQGCGQWIKNGSASQISGEVTYRERMALPPGTRTRVLLEDVSKADAPSVLLAEQTIESATNVPIPFRLSYDPEVIEPRHRYALRAEIRAADGQLLWVTTGFHGILGSNQPRQGLTLVLQSAALEVAAQQPAAVNVEAARTYVYECGELDAVVHTEPGRLTLLAQGSESRLEQVPSASGVRYEGEGRLFWTQGEAALLEIDGQRYGGCRSNAAKAPWADAAYRGVDFRALGNEPGWLLEVDEGKDLRLVTDYGERSLYLPAPAPRFEGGIVRYSIRTKTHDVELNIEPRACQDSMSGAAFEARVRLQLDGQEYLGCGRYLSTAR